MNAADNLIQYLYEAPECYASAAWWKQRLDEAGAVELKASEPWKLEKGGLYYVVNHGTQITAFRIGKRSLPENGIRIVAAHHDSPGFRLKPAVADMTLGYERASVEPYGGLILRGWFDRPLGLAGRVCVREEDKIVHRNICIREPIMFIPSVAIHQNRDVNDGAPLSKQFDMRPLTGQSEGALLERIACEAGTDPANVLSFELTPIDLTRPCRLGVHQEFIAAAGLDDRAMAHAAMTALIETPTDQTAVCALFDHEEIGSQSDRGMRGQGLPLTIDKICSAFSLTEDDRRRTLALSAALSADMAHATHPAHPEKAEPAHTVRINAGPVLKTAAAQSYTFSAEGSALFKMLCRTADVSYQEFVNHSDYRGGGTIGGMLASMLGIITVDVGNPTLAMHSVMELCGSEDHEAMIRIFAAMYGSDLKAMGLFE